jgi:CBS domain-containing protein
MSTDLLTLHEAATIKEALAALDDYGVSGAPVVDAVGSCVGVFSRADVVRRVLAIEDGEEPRTAGYFSVDPLADDGEEDSFAREEYDEEVLGRDTVGQWMSTDVQSVRPGASLREVCSKMVEQRIHRLLVIDGEKLRGLISTLDIVRLIAD